MATQNSGQKSAQQQQLENNVAVNNKTKVQSLMTFFEKENVQTQLKNALKENANEFIASVIDVYTNDSFLLQCDPNKVAMEALKAAVLKLPIIKSLGYVYIVPFKGVPTMMISYKGLIQLAIRTQQYRVINADVVYEGEFRSVNKLTGEYDLNGEKKSDTVIGYFAHFEMNSGFSKTLFMTKEKVQAHAAKYSKSYTNNNSAWKTDFDAMAMKTVLRGLFSKWGYLSTEMQQALTDDDRDVAEKTLNEIKERGNKTPMDMDTSGVEDAQFVDEFPYGSNSVPNF